MNGAMPPPGAEWQVGKTAASIRFVEDAERLLHRTDRFGPAYTQKLSEVIDQVKAGELAFDNWTDPETYMQQFNVI